MFPAKYELMKVLIVDDNCDARRMIRKFLLHTADEIRECSDGAEALSAYREFLPNWVLMDWEMPMNGLEATKDIIADFPAARILIVTNYAEKDLRQAAVEAGALGVVLKDDLIELNSILKRPTNI